MCYSATISFSAAAILLGTGSVSLRLSRGAQTEYRMWAWVPILFGIQQGLEGGVWLSLHAGNAVTTLNLALGFHFFSHFLWLWWIPLASGLHESHMPRKMLFFGIGLFGFISGGAVYGLMLLHPEWMHVHVQGHSIMYDFIAPYHSDIQLPVTPLMLYASIILLPLLLSSTGGIRFFGVLVMLSMALASWIHNAAFVSVWCFFAALISLYLVYFLRNTAVPFTHTTTNHID